MENLAEKFQALLAESRKLNVAIADAKEELAYLWAVRYYREALGFEPDHGATIEVQRIRAFRADAEARAKGDANGSV